MDQLPDSIVLKIFFHLTLRERLRHQIVSSRWKRILTDFSLWEEISVSNDFNIASQLTDEKLAVWLQRYGQHIRILKLRYSKKLTNQICFGIALHCLNLRYLDIQGCLGIGDFGIAQISESCRKLEKVNFFMSNVTETGCKELFKAIPGMTALKLPSRGNCHRILEDACKYCPGFKDLIINDVIPFDEADPVVKDEIIFKVAETFKGLQKLSLNWCWYITDLSLLAIANSNWELRHLIVRECHQITEEGIVYVIKFCRKLRRLQLGRLYSVSNKLSDAFEEERKLQVLKLVDTSVTDHGVSKIVQNCPKLRVLHVGEYCFNATRINGDFLLTCAQYCKYLREIHLISGKSISDLVFIKIGQNLPHLIRLLFSSCKCVSAAGLYSILNGCPKVQEARICKCNAVDNLFLEQAPKKWINLSSLELYGCVKVTEDAVECFSKRYPKCSLRV